jgi:hypothetical protein
VVTGAIGAALGGDTAGFCSLQPAAVIRTIKINALVRVIGCLLLNEVISTTRLGKGLRGSARNAFRASDNQCACRKARVRLRSLQPFLSKVSIVHPKRTVRWHT